jgi:hypothetical protein
MEQSDVSLLLMFAWRADQGIAVLPAHLAVVVTVALEHQSLSKS